MNEIIQMYYGIWSFKIVNCLSGPSEDYYLLCDALEEDKDIRKKLQIQRLVGSLISETNDITHMSRKNFPDKIRQREQKIRKMGEN